MTVETTIIHDLPMHTVRRSIVSQMQNNVYLITAKSSGAQILIDAADDLPAINALLKEASADVNTGAKASLKMIATTHQHWDHLRALPSLVAQSSAPTAAGTDDIAGIKTQAGVSTDVSLHNGGTLAVDGIELTTVHLRGHTPGSMAFILQSGGSERSDTLIFSGDSLFPGGVGNTGEDKARFTQLLDDVQDRLFNKYPDDAIVLPGHGNATTLGNERAALPQWRERGW
ncbi:MBL fold metallo-hydrolase [Arthrobacter antibioticus]|uniref:MBL fold metallo-hydrolase n=1 Tax=Arthrobacter sp. H35-MC1 TaxID=3046203 RepID=UPI0024B920D9|nr:MBL fold metallo-hydrolase [Arthrobacter sp. H35-MC1]MDJ0315631.1 MBL fold metallo-hydrolase [Arthrobacter sp. H35-MC1]